MPCGVVGPMEAPAEAAEEAPKEKAEKAEKEAMEEAMEEVNCQAGGEGIAVVNAVGGDFGMHRTFEVADGGGGEDFTAGNAAGGGVGRATAIGGEAGGAVGGGEVGGAGGAGGAGHEYLAKASLTAFSIIAFNSSSCLGVKPEAIEIEVGALLEVLHGCCGGANAWPRS